MHRRTRIATPWRHAVVGVALAASPWVAVAQHATSPATTLAQSFEAAWARQPDALALPARRDANRAQRTAASAWTPEPPALELSGRTDRLTRERGAREFEAGLSVPLWLPGERSRSAALADADGAALESRTQAARLRVAAAVREAWWNWQRARIDSDLARDQLDSSRRIAADVARRLAAGDLARADQHQAEASLAAAESARAQADAAVTAATQRLHALTGAAPADDATPIAEAEPDAGPADLEAHAELAELRDRAAVAERTMAVAETQSRANPDLTLLTTRDRGAFGEAYGQTVTLGVRIPFGGGARHDARLASARADALEAQGQLALERERLASERRAAQAMVDAARSQLAAAERRAALTAEARGFFDKAFRLGETDLPTRLRIEADAAEAQRQAARSRIELAAAISAWRQALGLLPQ